MTPAVLWMRHGTCEDGLCRPGAHARPHSPLTVGGSVEAEFTARQLQDHHWPLAVVVSSPLRRARQTASIAASTLGARVIRPLDAFAEWRAPSCVLGRTPSQYPPAYQAWRQQRGHDLDSALPGGESLRTFAERASEAARIAHHLSTTHGPALVVSHRLLIGAIAALHIGHRNAADIFSLASEFRLAPAGLWAPNRGVSP
ncbi:MULTISPECIES: histidine phosphatase family protein [Pseudonocardiaceae]|nr:MULTISPECIES: histidine phosphatase family protein [Pseudonocardiaceae]